MGSWTTDLTADDVPDAEELREKLARDVFTAMRKDQENRRDLRTGLNAWSEIHETFAAEIAQLAELAGIPSSLVFANMVDDVGKLFYNRMCGFVSRRSQ